MPDDTKPNKPIMGELAAIRGPYDIASLLAFDTTNPDQRIQQVGIEYFETEMELKDGHYRGALGSRKRALLRRGYAIFPASEDPVDTEIAEFVKRNLEGIEGTFSQDLRELLDAIAAGFAVSELIWEVVESGDDAGKVRLKALHHKPPSIWRFLTDDKGNLKEDGFRVAAGSASASTPVPKDKFVHFVFDSKYENPYGRGLGSTCSWYVWFKKNGLKFLMIFLERFGTPLVWMALPAQPTEEDKARVNLFLQTVQQATGLAVPAGVEPKLLEAVRRGEAGYIQFLDWCDKQISQTLLGQTLTSSSGDQGSESYALGTVHADVKEEIIDEDGQELGQCINEQLVKRLVDYNFITDKYPKFVFLTPKATAALDANTFKLLLERGLIVEADWCYEHFGIAKPGEGKATLTTGVQAGAAPAFTPAPAPSQFSERPYSRDVIEMTERMGEQVNTLATEGGLALSKALRGYRDALLDMIEKSDAIAQGKADALTGMAAGLSKDGIAEPLISGLVTGALLGRADSYTDLRGRGWKPPKQTFGERLRWIAFKESYRGLTKLLSPNGAYEYFWKRVPVPASVYAELEAWAKARAFAIAGTEAGTLTKAMQGHLLEAIDNGWDFQRFRFAVMSDPALQNSAPIREASTGYLETVFRTNLMSAYNEGSWEFYQDSDVRDVITAYQYIGILDSRECEICASMDGKEFLADDPIWDTMWPPNHFNCRCRAVGVTQYDDLNLADKVPVIDGKQVEPAEGFGGAARGYKVRGNA